MTLSTSTLRPGFLVSLKTSLSGNVSYEKRDIERPHVTAGGAELAKWETARRIDDIDEFERAVKVRGKAGSLVRSICAASAFGLLCPENQADKLDSAIGEARRVVDDFNAGASLTRLRVYVLVGRIAPDDVEAVRAINSEIRDLLRDMERGVASLDAEAIRAAAKKAKGLGQMLQPEAAARIQMAIDAARSAARQIKKAGESAAIEVDKATMRKIAESRTAFLDLSDDETEVSAPIQPTRAIDMEPEENRMVAAPQFTFALEL